MGDELGLPNDATYLEEPAKASDNRWMHRPSMDWDRAARRGKSGTVENRLFIGLRNIVEARKRTPHLNAATPTRVPDTHHPRVFAFLRPHPLGPLVAIHNFTEEDQYLSADLPRSQGVENPFDRLLQRPLPAGEDHIHLQPYESMWLTERP